MAQTSQLNGATIEKAKRKKKEFSKVSLSWQSGAQKELGMDIQADSPESNKEMREAHPNLRKIRSHGIPSSFMKTAI